MALFERKFEVLRVSITSHCPFGCVYCAPDLDEKAANSPSHLKIQSSQGHFLSPELFARNLDLLSRKINIKEIHLTGGEPTSHKDLLSIVDVAKKQGINEIALTTNGFYSRGLTNRLAEKGLTRMNFSVDSLDQLGFQKLVGRKVDVSVLLQNIEDAKSIGLKIKLNSTILKGFNDAEVVPLLQWAGVREIPIRYLELMSMGPLQARHQDLFYSALQIREQIALEFDFSDAPTEKDSTAKYYQTTNGFIFGIIANHTEPFCEGCNRLRMDVNGRMFGCLSDTRSYPISEDESQLDESLRLAMLTKQDHFVGSSTSMKYIGG